MDILRKTLDYVDTALEDAAVIRRQSEDGVDGDPTAPETFSNEVTAEVQLPLPSNTTTENVKVSFWSGVLPSKIVSRNAGPSRVPDNLTVEELRKELEKSLALNQQLKKRVINLEKENKEIFEEGLKFSTEAGQQESKVNFLRQKLSEAERVISKCNQRIEELTENNAILNETVAQINLDSAAQSEVEVKELRDARDTYLHKIEMQDREISQKTKEIECLRVEVEAGDLLRSRCQALESEVAELRATKESLRRELHQYTQREDSISYRQLEANRKLQQMEAEILFLRQQVEDQQSEATDQTALILLRNELSEYKDKLKEEAAQVQKLRKELDRAREALEAEKKLKVREIDALRIELQTAHEKNQQEERAAFEALISEKDTKIASLQDQLFDKINKASAAGVDQKETTRAAPANECPVDTAVKADKGEEAVVSLPVKASTTSAVQRSTRVEGKSMMNEAKERIKQNRLRSNSVFEDFKGLTDLGHDLSGSNDSRVKDEAYFQRVISILKHDLEMERREKQAYRDECLRLSDEAELARSLQSVKGMQQTMSH